MQGSTVECCVHCDKIKTVKSKVPSINYKYFTKLSIYILLQITFVTLNGFCLLSNKPPTPYPLFLMGNIKMDRIPTKIK